MTTQELSFRDFVERALYDPDRGYYSTSRNPVSKEGDYVTSPLISEAFTFAMGRLVREFQASLDHTPSTIVDIGCGDGALIRGIAEAVGTEQSLRFVGVDRSLHRASEVGDDRVNFLSAFEDVPSGRPALVVCNELYDAFPFARLVQRADGLHELWVLEDGQEREWTEKQASSEYVQYLESHEVRLEEGQFADVSLDWSAFHADLCSHFERGLIVVLDYGFLADRLFDPRIRRFGTAASYKGQRVHRDLLRDAGHQDLTAHVNFSDLVRAGSTAGWEELAFNRQAEFLLKLGITEHPDLAPVDELDDVPREIQEALELRERREAARRLVLPDGIGQEISVLVQAKGVPAEGWSFQKKLW